MKRIYCKFYYIFINILRGTCSNTINLEMINKKSHRNMHLDSTFHSFCKHRYQWPIHVHSRAKKLSILNGIDVLQFFLFPIWFNECWRHRKKRSVEKTISLNSRDKFNWRTQKMITIECNFLWLINQHTTKRVVQFRFYYKFG